MLAMSLELRYSEWQTAVRAKPYTTDRLKFGIFIE